ncbi:MAG: hypothetical protein ACP5OG_03080 [Candidatus Nanoarchaeia archaeon]
MALENTISNFESSSFLTCSIATLTTTYDSKKYCEYLGECDEAYCGKGCYNTNKHKCHFYKKYIMEDKIQK